MDDSAGGAALHPLVEIGPRLICMSATLGLAEDADLSGKRPTAMQRPCKMVFLHRSMVMPR